MLKCISKSGVSLLGGSKASLWRQHASAGRYEITWYFKNPELGGQLPHPSVYPFEFCIMCIYHLFKKLFKKFMATLEVQNIFFLSIRLWTSWEQKMYLISLCIPDPSTVPLYIVSPPASVHRYELETKSYKFH